ncbi:MAG: Lrp/AsnC family transcriptional regulator [Clostridiales bacterium]|nr:Lrp/AsnC family transcriptional regulator [Clostridiales bacterium]
MNDKLLNLLENNARLSSSDLAVMLGMSESDVEKEIKFYEDSGIIKGYKAIIDNEKTNSETVTALIELKIQPKYEHGFDDVAERIAKLEEVEAVYLMSGTFDLTVMVTDKSFHEVAMFVANRLSPLEGVVSTATHFILKKFKEKGAIFSENFVDDRGTISL